MAAAIRESFGESVRHLLVTRRVFAHVTKHSIRVGRLSGQPGAEREIQSGFKLASPGVAFATHAETKATHDHGFGLQVRSPGHAGGLIGARGGLLGGGDLQGVGERHGSRDEFGRAVGGLANAVTMTGGFATGLGGFDVSLGSAGQRGGHAGRFRLKVETVGERRAFAPFAE